MIHQALLAQAGPEGARLLDAARTLAFINGYAESKGWSADDTWPLSRLCAASLIAGEHSRATAAATGSRGGQTVGGRFRKSLASLASNFGCPIEAGGALVEGAAPKAAPGRAKQAATLPPQVYCHLEELASAPDPTEPPPKKGKPAERAFGPVQKVARYYARAFVTAGYASVRFNEALQLELVLDSVEPDDVIRGYVRKTKDGSPLDVFIPTKGFLGPFPWYRRHLADVQAYGGTMFPDFEGPRGCRTHINLATDLKAGTLLESGDLAKIFHSLLTLPPLAWSKAEIARSGVRGHSPHGSLSDLARTIGPRPNPPFELPSSLRAGFDKNDWNEIGLWLRSKRDKAEAEENRRVHLGNKAGRTDAAAGPGAMVLLYTSGDGRLGARTRQLDARRRLVRYVRLALAAYGRHWSELPATDNLAAWTALLGSLRDVESDDESDGGDQRSDA